MRVNDFVPPIVARIYGRARGARTTAQKRYGSYSDAMRDCGKGYGEDEIARVVLEKTIVYKRELDAPGPLQVSATDAYGLLSVAHLLARAEVGRREFAVLDLGGACGAHYFTFKKFFGDQIRLKWVVVETEVMCHAAQRLQTDDLTFVPDLTEALRGLATPDLLHVSGVLQFVERPYEMLDSLVKSGARYLLLSRLALTAKPEDLVTVHRSMLSWNGKGPLPPGIQDREVAYPYAFLSERKFTSYLSAYEPVVEFDDKSALFPVGDEPLTARGLLLRFKAAASPG